MNIRSTWIPAVAGMLMTAAGSALARDPSAESGLAAALAKAKTENKLLFVQYGREACGNCKALKSMIRNRQVRLLESDFVYADVNCDDPATSQAFHEWFKVEGNTLPFVVIAEPTGKQLAARSGYASAAAFNIFIKEAQRAYDKAQKAVSPAPTTPARLKPQLSGIAADDNREMRSWTSASGTQVTAALVEMRAGLVMLRKEDGTRIQIDRTSLSKADQDYLDQLRQGGSEATDNVTETESAP